MSGAYLSIPIAVSVYTLTITEASCINWTNGQKRGWNIQRFNMYEVYVNGIENKAMVMSESDKLTKNILSSGEVRCPIIITYIAVALPVIENIAVSVYKHVKKTLRASLRSVSKSSKVKFELGLTTVDKLKFMF